MPPKASRSLGKIVIKPRAVERGAPSPPRPTIRIGPRAAAAARGQTSVVDEDDEVFDVADEDETMPAEDAEGESSLTSNNGASTSRAMTQETDGAEEKEGEEEDEDGQTVDVDGDEEGSQAVDDVGTPQDDEDEDEEEVVPVVRGRGRGRPRGSRAKPGGAPSTRARGRGRGRGRPRGRPARSRRDEEPEIEEDEDGTLTGGKPFRRINDQIVAIDGDEYITEDNPKGDEKIDKWGRLLGGMSLRPEPYSFT